EPSRDACFAAVVQGALDECPGPPPPLDQLRSLAQKYGINRTNGRFFVTPLLSTNFFAFNHDRPAFAGPGQVPLAKAINYAIDRPALARVYGYLGARRTDQLLPAFLGRDESIYPIAGADPVTARKWLAKAKFKPTQLVLYIPSSATGVQVAN